MSAMNRVSDREGFDVPTRLRLVERDLDGFEAAIERLAERVDQRLTAITRMLIGLLVSTATGAVLLAINIAVLGRLGQ